MRLLRRGGVARTPANFWLRRAAAAEAVAREHAHDGLADQLFRILREDVAGAARLGAARIAGMRVVDLALRLVAGQPDEAGIDPDGEIAAVDVRRKGRIVLAPEDAGDPRRKTAENLLGRIDHVPLARG